MWTLINFCLKISLMKQVLRTLKGSNQSLLHQRQLELGSDVGTSSPFLTYREVPTISCDVIGKVDSLVIISVTSSTIVIIIISGITISIIINIIGNITVIIFMCLAKAKTCAYHPMDHSKLFPVPNLSNQDNKTNKKD